MSHEIHLISNRALMLGSLLMLTYGVMLELNPELAHEWFALVLALEPVTLMPLEGWRSVGWLGLAWIGSLHAAGALPLIISRVWKSVGGMRGSKAPERVGFFSSPRLTGPGR